VGLVLVGLVLLPFSCGGGSSAGSTATATDFCHSVESTVCDKIFTCVPTAARDADFIATFGNNPTECKAMSNTDCATAPTDCPTYHADLASTCVSKLSGLNCAGLGDQTMYPIECDQACPAP
jgi:hypothetical protein